MLGIIIDGIKEIINRREKKAEKKADLTYALRKALNHTRYHVGQQDLNAKADQPNMELSDLWAEVARQMNTYNAEYYESFNAKSQYWVNPVNWLEMNEGVGSIEDLGFKLAQIEELVAELEQS